MNRNGHKDVKFFIGPEVEMTPAHGKKTLFVVGEQPVDEIEKHAKENGATHVFLGANHSFGDKCTPETWSGMVSALLARNFTVTLDYPVEYHGLLRWGFAEEIWKSRSFIPLVSVRIPSIENSGPNLTVKIDDIDFAATNQGVWCMHYTELTDSNRFTGWVDYETDQVVGHNTVDKTVDEFQAVVNEVTLEINETVSVNLNDLGLDVAGTSAMEEKTKAAEVVETELTVTPTGTQPTAETGTASEKSEEVKETKKKAVRKND